MLLQDHFHPPLAPQRHWHSFHTAWAASISAALNEHLPEGYFAEPHAQFSVEIDVAAFEQSRSAPGAAPSPGGTATLSRSAPLVWVAPRPARTLPLTPLDEIVEILVFREEGGAVLVGAIELVSPANKDRPDTRSAFISKCAAYLHQAIGLLIVDVVTERKANLHLELLRRVGAGEMPPRGPELYACAYRPVLLGDQPSMEVWEADLALGTELPVMPLWLPREICIPVDLPATYARTCREQRIPAAAA
jgi:hypothetical protein